MPRPISPEQVFAPLIRDGSLEVAWHYDNASQDWTSFAPNAPAALNDIALLAPYDVVSLQLNADSEFQYQKLTKGWNIIALR